MIDNTFTAIDFETAHSGRHSICQVGLVRYENGMIVKEIDMLVKPPDNYYYYSFIRIHGINPGMTRFKPDFSEIWYYIEPYIKDQHLV
ncbi:MAG: hypothetical protein KA792_01020, partial [Bacteroidales bacterium]|nr:hypothetical protein [Bacteroidales bacterium]